VSDDADRWTRADRLFVEAVDLPPGERAAYLDRECGDDTELRSLVDRLLEHADRPDSILSPGGGLEYGAREMPREAGAPPPKRIGPYVVRERIGEGGFGEVFLAEQLRPVRRRVAIKLLKTGMDSHGVLARFDAERQALAMMDHPNIAKIFDAGETETGRPYFVMEFIDGEPVTAACDGAHLPIRTRLELLHEICRAVQHAHSKGILHRDLKPSNLLVIDTPDGPVPKVIDFGIAKAVDTSLTDETLYTMTGQLIGTPVYMSPERVEAREDADTRSDVYSLGVILYELLTGTLPLSPDDLRGLGLEGTLRALREHEPDPPSVRVTRLGDAAGDAAARRDVDVSALRRSLRGELDWITLKAIAKEPARRYETANAFAADLRRYLDEDAVEASPPSTIYRFRKFARRHRVALSLMAAILVGVVVAVGSLAYSLAESQRQRALTEAALVETEQARESAEAVTVFLADMLGSADPARRGREVTVREVLDEAAGSLEREMAVRPRVEARLRSTIGSTYRELGELEAAEKQFDRALEMNRELVGPDDPATLSTWLGLGKVYQDQGRLDEALETFEAVWALSSDVLGDEDHITIETVNNLATVHQHLGNFATAESLQTIALDASRAVFGPDDEMTLACETNLGSLHRYLGRLASAESLLVDAVGRYERALPPDNPAVQSAMANLGIVYYVRGKYEEAAAVYESVLAARRRILGEDHPETVSTMSDLAVMYGRIGRVAESESLAVVTLQKRREILGDEHPGTLQTMNNLAVSYGRSGRYAEADELLRSALEIKRRTLGPEHVETLITQINLGSNDTSWGRPEQGLPILESAVEIAERTLPPDHLRRGTALHKLGECRLTLGDLAGAEPLLLDAHALYEKLGGVDNSRTQEAVELLVRLYEEKGDATQAEAWRARRIGTVKDGESRREE
jgi:serine/threonine protein kinase